MTFATRNEIEYLSMLDRDAQIDLDLIEELGDRLEALRRYDQYVCEGDWRSREFPTGGHNDDHQVIGACNVNQATGKAK